MTGAELKQKLSDAKYGITDVATKIGMTQPNFSTALAVKDVKTGLIEKLCESLGLTIDFFYGDTPYYKKEKTTSTQSDSLDNEESFRNIKTLLSILNKKEDEFWKLKEDYEKKIEKLETTIDTQRTEFYNQIREKDTLINNLNKDISELRKNNPI